MKKVIVYDLLKQRKLSSHHKETIDSNSENQVITDIDKNWI